MEGKELQNVSDIVAFINKQVESANEEKKAEEQKRIKESTYNESNTSSFFGSSKFQASIAGDFSAAPSMTHIDGASSSNEDLLFPENYSEELLEANNYFSAAESDLGTALSYANNAVMEYETLIYDDSKSGLLITETRDSVTDLLEECTSFFISYSIVAQSFIASADEILRKIYDNDLLAKVGATDINSLTIAQENELIKYLADLGVEEAEAILKKGTTMGLKGLIDYAIGETTNKVVRELIESLGEDAIALATASFPVASLKFAIYKYIELNSGVLDETGALVTDHALSDILSDVGSKMSDGATAAKFYKGTISFVISAAASFIMSRINSDKTLAEDLTRALGISALGMASSAIATAVVTSIGTQFGLIATGAALGPVAAIAVVALGTIIEYVFTPVVDFIIKDIFYYDEGIPKTYQPMTNEELIEAMKNGEYAKELEDGTLVYRLFPDQENPFNFEGSTADYIAHLKDLGIDDNTIATLILGNGENNAYCTDILFNGNDNPFDITYAVIDFVNSYDYFLNCTDEELMEYAQMSGEENIEAYYEQLVTLREVFSPENVKENPELADILNELYREYIEINRNISEKYVEYEEAQESE